MQIKTVSITPEQIQGFIAWQQEKPNRKVEIKIGEKGFTRIEVEPGNFEYPNYTVCVMESTNGFVCQFVNDPSEIDLVAARKKDLEYRVAELQKLQKESV